MKKILGISLAFLSFSAANSLLAAGYVGGGLGASYINPASDYKTTYSLSADAGFQILPGFTLGADIQTYTYQLTDATTGLSANVSVIPFLFVPRFYLEGTPQNGFYGGPVLGFMSERIEVLGFTDNETSFTAGAQVGYEFNVTQHFGLGPKATYLYSFKTSNVDGFSFFSLIADAHFLF